MMHHRSDHRIHALFTLGLGLAACTSQTDEPFATTPRVAEGEPPAQISELPVLGADESVTAWVQLLPEPTPAGENVAVHVKLPPPVDPSLESSLVRVFGGDASTLLFRTDALVQLGVLEQSPGPDVFTTFVSLGETELEQRLQTEAVLAAGEDVSELLTVFENRTPVALRSGVAFDLASFNAGSAIATGPCAAIPTSNELRWEESLMITDPQVVQDPGRTHDACVSPGDPNGLWTFKHLMEEMAQGSGHSTHDFVVEWLSLWLNKTTINGDQVQDRPAFFTNVIEPWANASGVSATLNVVAGSNTLSLSGPLDLDHNPFHLVAIVNRLDLQQGAGGGGYGGGGTTDTLDAGELRFIFGLYNLDNCAPETASVILEYGVPITGCDDVRTWALDWAALNDGAALPRFSGPWLAHLETLTESVVLHGLAPGRGNDNAINQVRTNEFMPPAPDWELREFTLSIEDLSSTDTMPPGLPDAPANGLLLEHTVAMTPDDAMFQPPFPSSSPEVDDFVQNFVIPTVPGSGLPGDCSASYVVPPQHPSFGVEFKGGNSEAGPDHWTAAIGGSSVDICGRHQFSLNTCNGCHTGDTATPFFHVDPTTMPATLSDFLTGGGAGSVHTVPDTQVGASVIWSFADLERRYQHLYDMACTPCGDAFALAPSAPAIIADVASVVPLDAHPGIELPFPTGPITELGAVEQLLQMRQELIDPAAVHSVELDALVRPVQTFVH